MRYLVASGAVDALGNNMAAIAKGTVTPDELHDLAERLNNARGD